MTELYLNNPDKYVFPFELKEKRGKVRTIYTYNNNASLGQRLRVYHEKLIADFRRNFWDRNAHSFAYHKKVRCVDAIDSHLHSTHFIKLDIRRFFESINYDAFMKVYGSRFNAMWKQNVRSFFYKDTLSIGFVSSPLISDYYMSVFDEKMEDYLAADPFLHYSRYSDDILLSSEDADPASLNALFDHVVEELAALGLTLNEKKTRRISLSYAKHNSISFLGLNISKQDESVNKVTISKSYILFLLFLIEKNERYKGRCKELCDEINSRVAYLAYSSPVSFARFQKKHFNLYGKEYDFTPKKVQNRTAPTYTVDVSDYTQYLDRFRFKFHYRSMENETGAVHETDSVLLEKYIGKDSVVVVPDFVTCIGPSAFEGSSVTEVTLPKKLVTIGAKAFSNCTTLKKITMPDTVRVIGEDAFYATKALENIHIPARMKRINKQAFFHSGIRELEIPDHIEYVGASAFEMCCDLEKLVYAPTYDTVPERCFGSCVRLKEVQFGSSVTNIEAQAFSGCYSLSKLDLPAALMTLDASAFNNCYRLSKITIPASVVDIAQPHLLRSFETVEVDEKNSVYKNVGNVLMEGTVAKVAFGGADLPAECTTIGAQAYEDAPMERFVVPDGVRVIESNTFRNCRFLKEIILPNSIEKIGKCAFLGCISLKEVTIPAKITEISEGLFSGCYRLQRVHLPVGVTAIKDWAFEGCKQLEDLALPDSLTTLGFKPFRLCYSFRHLRLGKNLKKVNDYAFSSLSKVLESIEIDPLNVTFSSGNGANVLYRTKTNDLILGCKNSVIPDGIRTIHSQAFEYCNGMEKVILPTSVQSIGEGAFMQCLDLKEVQCDGVFEMKKNAFAGCCSLQKIEFPTSLVEMGESCFDGCRSLESVILPNSLSSLEEHCFRNCKALKSLFISASFGAFDRNWFEGCHDIEMIEVSEKNKRLSSLNGSNAVLEHHYGNYHLVFGCKNTVISDNDIISIEEKAFYKVKDLRMIRLPKRLEHIGTLAFAGTSLSEILIPASARIDSGAFSGCKELKRVIFEPNLDHRYIAIGNGAFENCTALEGIEIPSHVDLIGRKVFYGCENLASVTFAAGSQLEFLNESIFEGCRSLTDVVLPGSLVALGDGAFKGCVSLRSIELPAGIRELNQTFDGCERLEKVSLPEKLEDLGASVFNGCKALLNITLPGSLKSLAVSAYLDSGIRDLYVPASVTRIDTIVACGAQFDTITVDPANPEYESLGCNVIIRKAIPNTNRNDKLIFGCNRSVIPDKVREIGARAFFGCTELKVDRWPSELCSIEFGAFSRCSNFKKLVLPDKLADIGSNAFMGCGVEEVYIPASLRSIGENVFLNENEEKTLKKITVDPANPRFSDRKDNVIYDVENDSLLYCADTFKIPTGTKIIFSDAADGVAFEETLDIPDSVRRFDVISRNDTIKKVVLHDGLDSCDFLDRCDGVTSISFRKEESPYLHIIGSTAVMDGSGKKLLFLAKDARIPECTESAQGLRFRRNPDLYFPKRVTAVGITNRHASIVVDKANPKYHDGDCNCLIGSSRDSLYNTSLSSTPSDDISIICDGAYRWRDDMEEIYIGRNVKNIEIKTFIGCANLKRFRVHPDNKYYMENDTHTAILSRRSGAVVFSVDWVKQGKFAGSSSAF